MATEIPKIIETSKAQLNKDIEQFPQIFPITDDMHITHKGVSRMVMLDRYAFCSGFA